MDSCRRAGTVASRQYSSSPCTGEGTA
jgi:hypothetical protein